MVSKYWDTAPRYWDPRKNPAPTRAAPAPKWDDGRVTGTESPVPGRAAKATRTTKATGRMRTATTGSGTGERSDTGDGRIVFRPHRLNYIVVVILFLLTSLPVIYWPLQLGWTVLIPLAGVVWLARTRTVVSPRGIVTVSLRETTAIPWDDVRRIGLPKDGGLVVERASGAPVRLRSVTFRDLPAIAAASGGRVPNPFAEDA